MTYVRNPIKKEILGQILEYMGVLYKAIEKPLKKWIKIILLWAGFSPIILMEYTEGFKGAHLNVTVCYIRTIAKKTCSK